MPRYQKFNLGDVELQLGATLPNAWLTYKTYGKINLARDNIVLLPTFFTGTHIRNEWLFGTGRAINPENYFIISIDMFGNGYSSSPSNTPAPYDGPRFPKITLFDNIACQHKLLIEKFNINSIALVAGWSIAGCQAYQWGAQYPEMVQAILPFCASAKTSTHNIVFLEGVKAALKADASWNLGNYTVPPERGLRAFGRVYAGWAFSQTFFRKKLYQDLGFTNYEDLLLSWEQDHLNWDANNLLSKIWTWQNADISANNIYHKDFERALRNIKANAILIPCSDDLYFPPEDNEREARYMPNVSLELFKSAWGHCAGSPGKNRQFRYFLDQRISHLLKSLNT